MTPDDAALRRLYGEFKLYTVRSAADLAAAMDVTAAEIPEMVAALRRAGAPIMGDVKSGYARELPPPLEATMIKSGVAGVIGAEVRVYGVVESTMDLAREHARSAVLHGFAVVAEGQLAGRGRAGRSWLSPGRLGLYMSVVLAAERLPADKGVLALLAGIAVAEAVEQVARIRPALKWPNDLQIEGAKLGGVLMEATSRAVVMGVGVNVAHCPFDFPADLPYPATSLALAGAPYADRNVLAAAVLNRLGRWLVRWGLEGPATVVEQWKSYDGTLGRAVKITSRGIEGVAVDVTTAGALVVEDGRGGRHEVHAGDVEFALTL
jgi:BirA family biotin operon repressor/biotin-[acetyl-CoA-carboxylase] ligase